MMSCLLSIALYGTFFVGSLLLAVYLFFQHKYKTWKRLNIPYLEPEFPFGNVSGIGITQSVADSTKTAYLLSAGKPFVGLYTFASPYLLVRDPELIKAVLVRDFMHFHDRGLYYNEKVDPLSAHMFTIGGSQWKNLRAKLSPTFTSGKMKMMFPILSGISKTLVEVLKEPASKGEVIELKDYAARFTTDIIASCAFGVQADSLKEPNSTFRMMGRKATAASFENNLRATLVTFWPEMAERLGTTFNIPEVSKYFYNTIDDVVTHRKRNNIKGKDFLQLLIQLMEKGRIEDVDGKDGNEEASKFTLEEAAAEAFVFFIGGFETSSTATQFAIYELALNPDIQDRLRVEIFAVLGKHKNEMTYEAVFEMEYLGRVIDETLRKYPPVPIHFRECTKDYKVPNTDVVIPAGTRIQIPIYGIQNDPNHFPNPEKFDPDRFTEEGKATRHSYAYLPFGEGPRVCIGMRFGMMQTRVGLISLLSNYRFEVAESTPIPMVFDPKSIFPTPIGGMNLKITKL